MAYLFGAHKLITAEDCFEHTHTNVQTQTLQSVLNVCTITELAKDWILWINKKRSTAT